MLSIPLSKLLTRRIMLAPIFALVVGTSLLCAFPQQAAAEETAIGSTIYSTLDETDSQLSAGQFFDEYTFEGNEGQEILINLSSNDFDAFLWLLNSQGELIAIDDDTGDVMGALLSHFSLPETDTYTITISSHAAGETGAYTLSLNEAPWVNYSGGDPKEIAMGRLVFSGNLTNSSPQFSTGQYYDAYTFEAEHGQAVSIIMDSTNRFDPYLWLLDHEGKAITVNDDQRGNSSTRSQIIFFPPISGTYTILATTKEPQKNGQYILYLETTFKPIHPTIHLSGSMSGKLKASDFQLNTGQYLDIYYLLGNIGSGVTLRLSSSDFDSYLKILDSAGNVLREDDDTGVGNSALIENFVPPRNGYYSIWVSSVFAGRTGNYVLSLEAPSQDPSETEDSIKIALGNKKTCDGCADANRCVNSTQAYTVKVKICIGDRPAPLSASLSLSGSEGIVINPESKSFTINPNSCTVVSPFSIASVSASAGVKTITATVTGIEDDSHDLNVVEVGKIQYDDPDSGWTDVPDTLSILKDTTVTIKAIINPASGSWPSGKPVWNGTAGATGTGDTQTVTFDTLGDQTVTAECGDTKIANINVSDVLFQAIADCAPTSGTVPLTVRFRTRGEFPGGSIVRYRWDFEGDGNFNTSDAVARDYDRTFQQQGTYNSVLEVTNNLNETATDTCTIVTLGNNPTATVNAVPSNGSAPLLVNFTCTGTDTDGTIALYEWDFESDGVFDFNSPTSGNTSHTYDNPGTFTALCQVTDNDGLTGTASTINTVIRPGPPGSPSVEATATPTDGNAPLAVSFNGTATDDGSIVLWEWDFDGDGTFDFSSPTSPVTNFTYTGAGTFAAVLRVTDDAGLTAMDNIEIVVGVNASLSIANDTFDPTIGGTMTIDTSISADMPVRLLIKDNNGGVVRTLVNEARTAGNYSDSWDGLDDAGLMLPQGAYYAILEYEVDNETFSVDLTDTTGGSRYNPSRSGIPSRFSPFAGQPLTINFTLNRASEVTAFIGRFHVDTRLITFMERVPLGKGSHQIIWNGENADGQLMHPPSGDSFLFGIWGYTLPDNGIYLHSGAHISNFSVAPSIFDPTGHIDDQGTPEQSVLTFDLSNPADVELVVSDAETGATVAQKLFTGLSDGSNTVYWDGRDDSGFVVARGNYRLGVAAIDSTGYRSLRLYLLQRVYY